MAFGIEFQNVGIRLGSLNVADMSFSWSRILAFLVALGGMLVLWLFLKRTYLGTAIRAIAQDRADHAADGRRQPQALSRHLGDRRRARRSRRRR